MSAKSVEAIFIRHGQSTANIGIWDAPFAEIPLTELGWEQAKALAAQWTFRPSRIVVSPFLRAQQTAAATIARFPDVPVETWPIHEFTYWDKAHWDDSSPEQEVEEVSRFWRLADPEYRHGGRAESFGELLERTRETLRRLQALDVDGPVMLFTHGHFIQALRHDLNHAEWTDAEKMATFREIDERWRVLNTEVVVAKFAGMTWRLAPEGVSLAGLRRRV